MLKYLLRQPVNGWRTLGWLHKIEIILLIGLIYIVTIGKIFKLYNDWLTYDWITSFELANLLTHFFILSLFLSGPFILLYLLPRQSGLHSFYSKPLSIKQLFQLIGYYYFKYQAITIILYLVFLSALFGVNWVVAIVSILIILTYGMVVFIVQFNLFRNRQSNLYFWILLFLIFILYICIYNLSYWCFALPWVFDCIFLAAAGFILYKKWPQEDQVHLELIFPKKTILWRWMFENRKKSICKISRNWTTRL